MDTFSGIFPILYAWFNATGALDRAAMRRQTAACLASGAHGLAVLGLATEVGKLTPDERRAVAEWAAEDVAGRVPLAVTIFGQTPEEQIDAVRHAAAIGAALVILQPPRLPGIAEHTLRSFFGRVIDASPVPVGIQNAPEYIGIGLSPDGLARLARDHPSLRVLKAEGPATLIARIHTETGGRLSLFNGRGGLELPDILRAGCAGMIPAPDICDTQVRIFKAMRDGDEATAERLYRDTLPVIVFVMQSLDHLVCYGKRIVAARLGLGPVFDRAPGLEPNAFGEAAVARFAARLGMFPGEA